MRKVSTAMGLALAMALIVPVGADSTVDVVTVSAGKKVVTTIDTETLEAETTKVLCKEGASWVEDEVATEDAREKLEEEREAEAQSQQSVVNDCDGNGVDDLVDISAGAADYDGDGRLDACEYAFGDLNLNGVINQQDVNILLGWWGIPSPLYGDLDGDGTCGPQDLGVLLARWGLVP
jgi:hypothetical protein